MHDEKCNLVIIGAGSAGLSAGIRAGSNGYSVTLLDRDTSGYGGQMGHTSRIDNYPGFPDGITGEEFIARLVEQAQKLGTKIRAPFEATRLSLKNGIWTTTEAGGETIESGMVLLTAGVLYRSLNATNIARYLGRGISYGPPSYIENFEGKNVSVVGGGNSAAQAALILADKHKCDVLMIVRGQSFAATMDDMHIQRINKCKKITVMYNSEITEACGAIECLKKIFVKSADGGISEHHMDRMFILIGAVPKTVWLDNLNLAKDARGFIQTGSDVPKAMWKKWKENRVPYSHEAAPGLFVAGDIHSGSSPSIATASGDASIAVTNMDKFILDVWEKKHASAQ